MGIKEQIQRVVLRHDADRDWIPLQVVEERHDLLQLHAVGESYVLEIAYIDSWRHVDLQRALVLDINVIVALQEVVFREKILALRSIGSRIADGELGEDIADCLQSCDTSLSSVEA